MKKSFFVGLLASVTLAEDSPFTQLGKTYGDQPLVAVTQPTYPTINFGSGYSFGRFRGGIPSSSSYYSANQAVSNAISTARSNIATTNLSIDSLFLRLPSAAELDRLILNADSVALLKTIQIVATDDSLTCDQRIAYLSEVLGRIRTAVEAKQFAADQLKVIIDGAIQSIARLEGEINRLEGKITDLWLDELQTDLKDAIVLLQNYYRQYNSAEATIAPIEAQVAGYRREVQLLTQVSDGQRNRISTDRLKLTEVQASIRDIEGQLAAARERRALLQGSIASSQQIIRNNDLKIEDSRDKIDQIEGQIRRLRDEVDRLRSKYNDLEVQVERLRTDVSIANVKKDNYIAQINDLEIKIAIEREKLVQPEIDNLQNMIASLRRMIPTAKSEIDRHYYYCYGDGAVTTREVGGIVVYIVQGARFKDYLQNNYGSSIFAPGVSVDARNEVRFTDVDIFGGVWTNKFGYPFPDGLNGNSNVFDINGSFNCLTPSATSQGLGKIVGVGANFIDVDGGNGQKARLNLGSCSRLEATGNLPQIGQQIAYSAVNAGNGHGYNLYKGSCW